MHFRFMLGSGRFMLGSDGGFWSVHVIVSTGFLSSMSDDDRT